jgi:hypothetical protein
MDTQSMTKRERRELRKEEQRKQSRQGARKKTVRNFIIGLIVVGLVGGGIVILNVTGEDRALVSRDDIIARTGIHTHPEIEIYIHGEAQEITKDIGIGIKHSGMHTHDTDGVIHNEVTGLVTTRDTELGRFFNEWGRDFNSECIFEFCNGPDGTVTMTVNGESNFDFEKYQMKDHDRIEIRFE